MRHIVLPAVAAVVLAATGLAAQESRGPRTQYWPLREIGFPVPRDVLELSPRPVKLRLYSAKNGGAFEMVAERPANGLDPIEGKPAGFKYTTQSDGDEEFAVQLVYEDGQVSTRPENLRTEFRIVFDTRPPGIRLAPRGQYGVEWHATDDNLDPESLRLQCRWSGTQNWHEPTTRSNFQPRDSYTWASLAQERRTLEVRVLAKDRAGHEAASRIVTLPAQAGAAGLDREPGEPILGNGTSRGGSSIGEGSRPRTVSGEDFPGDANIIYVNNTQLTITSKLMHVTRSGVKAVHLFVKDMSNPNGEWKYDKAQPCNIPYESVDNVVQIPYTATNDGRYGFIVIPESGVGRREPDPRPSAAPQHLVEVDKIPPTVKIRNVLVSPGGAIGPRVEIEWDADDRNMMPDPIVLEYAPEKTSREWKSIAEKIPNSRRYVWEVADNKLFKFYIRIRAVDKASNTGEHIYDQEVIVDLDRPSATIDQIKPSGSGGGANPGKMPAPVPAPTRPTAPKPTSVPDVLPPVGK